MAANQPSMSTFVWEGLDKKGNRTKGEIQYLVRLLPKTLSPVRKTPPVGRLVDFQHIGHALTVDEYLA